jgi:hypothetical protein
MSRQNELSDSLEGISLDKIQLQTFPPTTPGVAEPATLPMLSVTLGVLVAVRRRFNSRKYPLS